MSDRPQAGTAIRDVSDTALWVAIYRAQESERKDALFNDPYARRLAGERAGGAVLAHGAGLADAPAVDGVPLEGPARAPERAVPLRPRRGHRVLRAARLAGARVPLHMGGGEAAQAHAAQQLGVGAVRAVHVAPEARGDAALRRPRVARGRGAGRRVASRCRGGPPTHGSGGRDA